MNAFAKVDKETFYRFMAVRREGRYEYVRGRIVQQMTGGTLRHGLVARRITSLIESQVDASRWHVVPERGVETSVTIRYPEVVLELKGGDLASLSTKSPAVVVEVLSPSTTAVDLDDKPSEYMSLASLDAYVVASQDELAILLWVRGADGTFPAKPQEIGGLDAVVEMNGRGFQVSLPLAAIYEGIA